MDRTFGQKAVNLQFESTDSDAVKFSKKNFARVIDQLNDLRTNSKSQEQKILATVAIEEIQVVQRLAAKALDWGKEKIKVIHQSDVKEYFNLIECEC